MATIGYSPLPTQLSQFMANAIGYMTGSTPPTLNATNCANPQFKGGKLGVGATPPPTPYKTVTSLAPGTTSKTGTTTPSGSLREPPQPHRRPLQHRLQGPPARPPPPGSERRWHHRGHRGRRWTPSPPSPWPTGAPRPRAPLRGHWWPCSWSWWCRPPPSRWGASGGGDGGPLAVLRILPEMACPLRAFQSGTPSCRLPKGKAGPTRDFVQASRDRHRMSGTIYLDVAVEFTWAVHAADAARGGPSGAHGLFLLKGDT